MAGLSLGGTPTELRRALMVPERDALSKRLAVLNSWLQPGMQADMKESITTMMMNLSKRSIDPQSALLMAEQWAHVLRDLTGWAVYRACRKFEQGMVRPADVGADKFDPGWEPNTAQLSRVARAIEQETRTERNRIDAILKAPVTGAAPRRATTGGSVAAHLKRMNEIEDERQQERVARQEQDSGKVRQTLLEQRTADFVRAGLKPPEPKGGIIPSLAMFKRNGFTIEEVGGERVLVAPKQSA